MFGILTWSPPERGKRRRAVETAERMVLHTRFACAYVQRGPHTPEAVVRAPGSVSDPEAAKGRRAAGGAP